MPDEQTRKYGNKTCIPDRQKNPDILDPYFRCDFLLQDVSGGGGLGDENVMAVAGEDGQHYVVLEVIQMDEDEDGDNQVGHHEVDGHEKVKVIAGGGGHQQVSQIACTAQWGQSFFPNFCGH